jgi:hypothetical protein
VQIVFQAGDQPAEIVDMGERGGDVRVAFGGPERHGAIWKVVAARKGEVYVMERTTGRALKISLHASGDWRFAWVRNDGTPNPVGEEFAKQTGSRVIDQWQPLAPVKDTLTIGTHIWTTADDLAEDGGPGRLPSDVIWLDPPKEDEMGFLTVALVRPTGTPISIRGYLPLAGIGMANGEAVLLLASRRPMRAAEKEQLQSIREGLATAREQVDSLRNAGSPRAIVPVRGDDGQRHFLDLSL